MRQADPKTNLVLAVLAAFGLVGTLSLPWFAPSVKDTNSFDGPIERGAFHVSHVFSSVPGSASGSEALGGVRVVVYAVAAAIVILAAIVSIPQVRTPAEDLLRVAALLSPPAVIFAAIAHQGGGAAHTVHYGTFAAFAVSVAMASAAWQACNLRARHKQASSVRFSPR